MASMYSENINPLYREFEAVRERWGWFLAVGIVLIILGIIALGAIVYTTLASVLVLGTLLLVAGVVQAVIAFTSRQWRGFLLHLLMGVFYGVVGAAVLANPAQSLVTLTLVLAVLFVGSGIARIVAALVGQVAHRVWRLIDGAVTLAVGLLIWANWPEASLWVIGMFIGIDLITTGAMWVALALAIRPAPGPRGRPLTT